MQATWTVQLKTHPDFMRAFDESLAEDALATSFYEIIEGELWAVEGVFAAPPDINTLSMRVDLMAVSLGIESPALSVIEVPDCDWIAHVYKGFPPIHAGRYYIYGSHIEGNVPPGKIGLLVDAATAFGTGEHASTWGCLIALGRIARSKKPRRVLDMGCGTTILGMAAAKTWHVPVLATDVDPIAVDVSKQNIARNGLSQYVRALVSDGYAHPMIGRMGPYDLVLANILAPPLVAFSADLAAVLAPGGRVVLAGLLARQAPRVLAAHRRQGLFLVEKIIVGEWATLVLGRR
jgi:ribosomal protein L11 methyltransferase